MSLHEAGTGVPHPYLKLLRQHRPIEYYTIKHLYLTGVQNVRGNYIKDVSTFYLSGLDVSGKKHVLRVNVQNAFYIDIGSKNPKILDEATRLLNTERRQNIYNTPIEINRPWINNQGDPVPTRRFYLDSPTSLNSAYNTLNELGMPDLLVSLVEIPEWSKTYGHLAHLGIEFYTWLELKEGFDPSKVYELEDLNFKCKQLPYIPGTNMFYDIEVTMDIFGGSELSIDNPKNKICAVTILFVGHGLNPVAIELSLSFDDHTHWEIFNHYNDWDSDNATLMFCGTFATERDLVKAWAEALQIFDPLNMIDYNGSIFDMAWLLHRFEKYDLQDYIKRFGSEYKTSRSGSLLTMFEQFGGPKRQKRYTVYGPSFVHLDLMTYVVTNKLSDKKTGNGLNAVCNKYNLKGKIGIKHWVMSFIFQSYWMKDDPKILEKIYKLIKDKVIARTEMVDNVINIIERGDHLGFKRFAEDMLHDYTHYCYNDTYITWLLSERLTMIQSLYVLGSVSKTYVTSCLYNGVSVRLKGLLAKYSENNGINFGNQHGNEYNTDLYILGGITLPPLPLDPIHQDFLVTLDMTSFYATVMKQCNIGPDTICDKEIPGAIPFKVYDANSLEEITSQTKYKTRYIRHDRESIYAKICADLMNARVSVKKEIKEEKDQVRKKALDALQLALKLTGNGLFGFLASQSNQKDKTYPFINYSCATAITQYAGSILCLIGLYLFEKFGMVPVMAVTDSLAILIDPRWADIIGVTQNYNQWRYEIGLYLSEMLENEINDFLKYIFDDQDCVIRIACENLHWGLNINVMKRYVYRALDKSKPTFEEAHDSGKDKVVGYTQIRVDSAPIINEISDAIDKYLLGVAPRNYKVIGQKICEIKESCMRDPYKVSKLEDLTSSKIDMRGIRAHMILLNKLGIIRELPPLFDRQNIMQVELGCEYISPSTHRKQEWQKMQLGYITSLAVEKNLEPQRKYVNGLINSLIREKINKEYQDEVISHANIKEVKERVSLPPFIKHVATEYVCQCLNIGRNYLATKPDALPIVTLETLEKPALILDNFRKYSHLFKDLFSGNLDMAETIINLNKKDFDDQFYRLRGIGIYVGINYCKALPQMKTGDDFPADLLENIAMVKPMIVEANGAIFKIMKKIILNATL